MCPPLQGHCQEILSMGGVQNKLHTFHHELKQCITATRGTYGTNSKLSHQICNISKVVVVTA